MRNYDDDTILLVAVFFKTRISADLDPKFSRGDTIAFITSAIVQCRNKHKKEKILFMPKINTFDLINEEFI